MKKEKTLIKEPKEDEKEDKIVKEVLEIEKKVIKVEGADVLEEVPGEEELEKKIPEKTFDMSSWKPKTSIGLKVKNSEIKDIDEILDAGLKIMEPEIVDVLLPNLNIDLLMIGQSKGKFGGGQRRIFKQTQKKTQEGNKPKFATMAVVGNNNGYYGIGYGKAKETVPAREKSIRNAKLDVKKIRRGCGSWQCNCNEPHSIPFTIIGKCGSCVIKLIPAPKGTGLKVESECAKLLKMCGIKDAWSRSYGRTKTKFNLISACDNALQNLVRMKVKESDTKHIGLVEGKITNQKVEE